MIAAADISASSIWAWASGSSLFSTILTLVVGSLLLYKWQSRRSFEYEVVKFVSDEISSYADAAVQYWNSFVITNLEARSTSHKKIKNGLPVLHELINDSIVLDKKGKKDIDEALGRLYDAATGGRFESTEKIQREEAETRIEEILYASTISRRVLFLAATKK